MTQRLLFLENNFVNFKSVNFSIENDFVLIKFNRIQQRFQYSFSIQIEYLPLR